MKNKVQSNQSKSMQKLVNDLRNDKCAGPFLEPVNWEALGLFNYPQIIKKPMDLQTILQKIHSSQYEYLEEFFADIHLIWSNCKLFNICGSEIYKMAESLERKSNKLIKEFMKH